MVLTLPISKETEARLKMKAQAAGVDLTTYATTLLDIKSHGPRSVEELSGPIAEAFTSSGMTEEKLAELLESEKHAMRREKRAQRNP